MGGAIGRRAAGIDCECHVGIGRGCGKLKLPLEHGNESEVCGVFSGELEAAGFQYALAAVIVAVRGGITVVMLGLAIARQETGTGPNTMRGGRQPSRQHRQCRNDPEYFHRLPLTIIGSVPQGFSRIACVSVLGGEN